MRDYLAELDMSIVAEVADYPGLPAPAAAPKASVIIVAYNTSEADFSNCLNSLQRQTFQDFEIIVVDNSDKADVQKFASRYALKYIRLRKNYGLTIGRNVGIKYARGEILIFLDDDAAADNDFIAQHLRAYSEQSIAGLRGKSTPKTDCVFNLLARSDDLGEHVLSYYINLEGNSSFRKDVLIQVGGFNSTLQSGGGGEGLELSYRITKLFGDKNKLIYYPQAVIYHDYYGSFRKYARKRLRHRKYRDMLDRQFPELREFEKSYPVLPVSKQRTCLGPCDKIRLWVVENLLTAIVVARSLVRKSLCRR
jgi:glycosyltransferase involved in cell wall biosynthesis